MVYWIWQGSSLRGYPVTLMGISPNLQGRRQRVHLAMFAFAVAMAVTVAVAELIIWLVKVLLML